MAHNICAMESDQVPTLGSGVNYEEVDALSQKRIITFINEFVCQTVTFLNKFASNCEDKLITVDNRLEKLETMLSILEAKLSSVPDLATRQTAPPQRPAPTSGESVGPAQAEVDLSAPPPLGGDQSAAVQPADDPSTAGLLCLRQTEPYRRYFRMLEVGVPEPAVRLKMCQEGLDPDALQRGGELVPPPDVPTVPARSDTASWASDSSGS
ncbi:WASH complex subunit 3-like isoform X2 [Pollicipes pollicipes]|uniref:WASH complex subunit 3-like isoform X2 n=1 Tax=Pollicipes pollicipes TaxID=41117 RepID=UPI001884E017|nr:WASH complex subunit 3-like isoform X2 [Pollicipes pollicipes]